MNKKIRIVSLILGVLFTILPHVSLHAETKENSLIGAIKKPKNKKTSQSMGNISAKEDTDLLPIKCTTSWLSISGYTEAVTRRHVYEKTVYGRANCLCVKA